MKTTKPLDWKWENGIGFLPFGDRPVPYDEAYFFKYQQYAMTAQGAVINDLRVRFVEDWSSQRFVQGDAVVLDIGIGCGCFVELMRKRGWSCFGTDVNPVAIEWLTNRGLLFPFGKRADVLTFWDVLEHIPDPEPIFKLHDPEFIFVAMPIYETEDHVFRSKHYRPGEHCWYFNREGLIRFMRRFGFECLAFDKKESVFGQREDIFSFAFRKIISYGSRSGGIRDEAEPSRKVNGLHCPAVTGK